MDAILTIAGLIVIVGIGGAVVLHIENLIGWLFAFFLTAVAGFGFASAMLEPPPALSSEELIAALEGRPDKVCISEELTAMLDENPTWQINKDHIAKFAKQCEKKSSARDQKAALKSLTLPKSKED